MTTPQQAYDLIKSKAVEANPSIMDLKEGCRVIIQGGYKRVVWLTIFEDDENCDRVSHVITEADSIGMIQRQSVESLILTIGRDIRLADVLVAIRETDAYKGLTDPLREHFIDKSKSHIYPLYWEISILKEWNLTNDSLYWHLQNAPETVVKIAEMMR